ncbi:hypothetical protein DFP74_4065 [Nocardiopsis sp. Huas11]|uniref:hypothetical protein n=1 Tax=Nocardiopsis sp. Huas11 TaxID=2183912 RepID=UPI000F1D85AC|nr:hypothetical protein [Nocardiopsis sp. Huas11]RKS08368.1 hypothetical protein DFP74_4065 [Nocardiopsis sp. Huas11]
MRPLDGTEEPGGGGGGRAEAARSAASGVASSAKDQVRSLAEETRAETGHVVDDVQDRVRKEMGNLTGMASDHLRQWSQDLESMAEHGRSESPVGGVVRQVAESGTETADFLEDRGVEGLLAETRDLARRRPVAFLVGAAVAGFTLGRLLKASSSASQDDGGSARTEAGEHAQTSAPLPRQGDQGDQGGQSGQIPIRASHEGPGWTPTGEGR